MHFSVCDHCFCDNDFRFMPLEKITLMAFHRPWWHLSDNSLTTCFGSVEFCALCFEISYSPAPPFRIPCLGSSMLFLEMPIRPASHHRPHTAKTSPFVVKQGRTAVRPTPHPTHAHTPSDVLTGAVDCRSSAGRSSSSAAPWMQSIIVCGYVQFENRKPWIPEKTF